MLWLPFPFLYNNQIITSPRRLFSPHWTFSPSWKSLLFGRCSLHFFSLPSSFPLPPSLISLLLQPRLLPPCIRMDYPSFHSIFIASLYILPFQPFFCSLVLCQHHYILTSCLLTSCRMCIFIASFLQFPSLLPSFRLPSYFFNITLSSLPLPVYARIILIPSSPFFLAFSPDSLLHFISHSTVLFHQYHFPSLFFLLLIPPMPSGQTPTIATPEFSDERVILCPALKQSSI